METIISARSRAVILTLVERYTGLILVARVADGKALRAVARTAVLLLAPYKGKICSITTDNGTEFRGPPVHHRAARGVGLLRGPLRLVAEGHDRILQQAH